MLFIICLIELEEPNDNKIKIIFNPQKVKTSTWRKEHKFTLQLPFLVLYNMKALSYY